MHHIPRVFLRKPTKLTCFTYTGLYRYSLTLCTFERRRLFISGEIVDLVLTRIPPLAGLHEFEITAYCFMPDHLHLLATAESDQSDLRRFLCRLKQLTGYDHSRKYKTRLWQRYSWDRVLRRDEDTWTVIRYILANPVRALLVEQPMDYQFSGSLKYSREELISAFADCQAG